MLGTWRVRVFALMEGDWKGWVSGAEARVLLGAAFQGSSRLPGVSKRGATGVLGFGI